MGEGLVCPRAPLNAAAEAWRALQTLPPGLSRAGRHCPSTPQGTAAVAATSTRRGRGGCLFAHTIPAPGPRKMLMSPSQEPYSQAMVGPASYIPCAWRTVGAAGEIPSPPPATPQPSMARGRAAILFPSYSPGQHKPQDPCKQGHQHHHHHHHHHCRPRPRAQRLPCN